MIQQPLRSDRQGPGDRSWLGVAALAVAASAASVAVGMWLLPLGSLNRDESTYLEFATMLADGRLTLDAADHRAFRPWASGIIDGHVVLKYAPVWPAVLAFGRALTGSFRVAPAVVAAACVLLVFALARAVTRDRGVAVAAAAATVLSPLFLIQSATFLSYLFHLVLVLATAVLLLRTIDGRAGAAAGAGLLFGLALFSRPFDAVLFVAPFAFVAFRARPRRIPPFVAGTVPTLLLQGAYNAAVLGSPFRLPFTVTGRADTFGFGRRGVFPGATVPFEPLDGLWAMVANAGWLTAWVAGGPVLVALAVHGFRQLPRSEGRTALAALTVLYPAGYLAFWGSYAVVHFWKGAATLGPFYHLPLLVPLAVFGAAGLARLPRPRARVAVAVGLLVTVVWSVPKVEENARTTGRYRAAASAVDGATATGDPAVLLASDRGIRGYDSWTPFLHNRPDLDQPTLYADERGPADFALVDRYPDRRFLRLIPGPTTNRPDRFRVVPVERVASAGGLRVRTAAARDLPSAAKAYVVEGRREQEVPLDDPVTWTLASEATAGAGADPTTFVVGESRGEVAFGVEFVGDNGHRQRWEQRVAYRVVGDRVEVLAPGRGFRRLARHWVAADVVRTLRVDYGV